MGTYTLQKFDINHIYQILMYFGKETLPDFELNEHDKEVYLRIVIYFLKENAFLNFHPSYDLRKGLLVLGESGVGKTIMFHVIKKSLMSFNVRNDFGIFKTTDIAGKYSMEGYKVIKEHGESSFYSTNGIPDRNKPKMRLYDDLGCEKNSTSFYGTRINVMEQILLKRFDFFIESGMKTLLTSNLNGEQIGKNYGNRVRSRLREMTNIIYYPGVDRRK